jgi:hypothetical protein
MKMKATQVRGRALNRSAREYFAIVGNDRTDDRLWVTFSELWGNVNKECGGEDREMPSPKDDVWRGEKVKLVIIPEAFAYRLIEMKREGGWQSFVLYRQTRGELLKEWKPPKKKESPQEVKEKRFPASVRALLTKGLVTRASDVVKNK